MCAWYVFPVEMQDPRPRIRNCSKCFSTWAWFFCLVFHREQTVSWAELRQASVKSPARVELSLAYSLLTVENQTKKPGPGSGLLSGKLRLPFLIAWPSALPSKVPASLFLPNDPTSIALNWWLVSTRAMHEYNWKCIFVIKIQWSRVVRASHDNMFTINRS